MKEKDIQRAEEVPITEVLERLSVPYQMVGSNAKIICPFHSETEGSMMLYEDHYHCFGCGEHGNSIQFVRKVLGLSFKEAVEMLNLIANEK